MIDASTCSKAGAAVVACLVIGLLAGCSGGTGSSAVPSGDRSPVVGQASQAPEPEPSPSSTAVDVCGLVTAAELSEAFGLRQGDASVVDQESDTDDPSCSWNYPEGGRAQLGATSDQSEDVTVTVHPYDDRVRSSGTTDWYSTDATTLIDSYFAANQEQIGSNPIAVRVDGIGEGAVQDVGETVVALPDRWFSVTVWGTAAPEAKDGGQRLARAVAAALAD